VVMGVVVPVSARFGRSPLVAVSEEARRSAGGGDGRDLQDGALRERGGLGVWQNRLNYSGSSALVIAIQPILTQCTSNGTTHWSVGSPLDTTMVQQDRSRFTSHEGKLTITQQLTNF
jgi:hypothetical protein